MNKITQRASSMRREDFYRILLDIMQGETTEYLLTVPGVYEHMAEHFNNEVLAQWAREQEQDHE